MRLEQVAWRCLICMVAALGVPGAHAQRAQSIITPSLGLEAQATSNALASTGGRGKKELITTTTPGLDFQLLGSRLEAQGQWRVAAIHFVRKSQPDRLLPTGQSTLRMTWPEAHSGIEATASAAQVQSTFLARAGATPSIGDTYTNVSAGISPYFHYRPTASTQVAGRFSRSQTASIGEGAGLVVRPKALVLDDRLSWAHVQAPLGLTLIATHQSTQVQQQANPSLDDLALRLKAQYTFSPEWRAGASVGRSRVRVETQTLGDTPRGLTLAWTPTPRSAMQADWEHRYHGASWTVNLSHRMPWMAFSFFANQAPVTYASLLGSVSTSRSLSDLYSAMLTTRVPDETERQQLVNALMSRRQLSGQLPASGDVYDVQARMSQQTAGRLALMGRRDILTLAGGLNRSKPLSWDQASEALLTGNQTKEYYFDAQLNHQLTPDATLAVGARWTQASSYQLLTDTLTLSRDFSWRMNYNISLSPRTTATLGVRRQIAHNPSPSSSNETAGVVGVLHRF
jgi:uncharacterized protein (PEP-CTERM system associated)